MKRVKIYLLGFLTALALVLSGCGETMEESGSAAVSVKNFPFGAVPEYSGQPYAAVHDNVPFFEDSELTEESFEQYGSLDEEGRCQTAYACVGTDLMPTEKRGSISHVKPTGWHTAQYDTVDGKNLYNRCHLIGYQLTGENANEENLITGTRYLNVDGMLPFENMVADYVKETGNHVMYRVTPVFEGDNLVASGVLMEGKSVEDDGEGILFCAYAYNVQPGIVIDYATGESYDGGGSPEESALEETYILNISSKKFHRSGCSSVQEMKEQNREEYAGSREELIRRGYAPCKSCNP
ncbi:MAG: DNA/RNA non-specific endonuclease [Clostridium sp.]|jgi:DNA-entry nuclease